TKPGAPQFGAPTEIAQQGGVALAAADIDGDGRIDLVLRTSTAVAVLLNATSPVHGVQFLPGQSVALASFDIPAVEVADFNADGIPDLIVDASAGVGAQVLINTTPRGTTQVSFGTPLQFAFPGATHALATAADLDGDGYPELVIATSVECGFSSCG